MSAMINCKLRMLLGEPQFSLRWISYHVKWNSVAGRLGTPHRWLDKSPHGRLCDLAISASTVPHGPGDEKEP